MPFWCEVILAASGVGGRGQLQRPEIVLQKEQTSGVNIVYCWRKNLSAVSLTLANSLSPESLTPVIKLLPVSTTPAIKFFPGVVDTGKKQSKSLKFSPVSTTPPKNCSPVSMPPLINYLAVSTTPAYISLSTPKN
jgi:hypothetical protein